MTPAAAAVDLAPAVFTPVDFAALMARFAPFEPQPLLALAVSGGGDSMALALLAHDWARARGGQAIALTVDHGLRPEAAAEAAQVACWCAARGIAHVTLRREAPLSRRGGVQAAARAARFALLETWCRAHQVLHLLLAHHSDDQAETVAIRAASGSGLDGLAGMAAVSERGAVRLLRPFLAVSRAQLRAVLVAHGQEWIEDPSNRNPAFTRVRVRDALGRVLPGSSAAHLAGTAARLGWARAASEAADAARLARALMLHPAGFAWLDPDAFRGPDGLGAKALGAILATVSGSDYPPRGERLARLAAELAASREQGRREPGRTLGGCLVLPRRGRILICREPAAVAAPARLVPGTEICWDGRFEASVAAGAGAGLWLGALGRDSVAVALDLPKTAALGVIPPVARATLPALRDAKGVVAVPALGYFKRCREEAIMTAYRVSFRPKRSLTGAGFTIV